MKKHILQYFIIVGLTSLATLLILQVFHFPATGIDDANITFVYAKNYASGHGFVYNIGGERVEGFTSLLWVLICAALFKCTSNPEVLIIITNILLISFGATLVFSYLQSLDFVSTDKKYVRPLVWPILYIVVLLSAPAYVAWTTITLMENGIWSTLLLLTTILILKDDPASPKINPLLYPLSAMLLLTRPESLLWVPVFVGLVWIRKICGHGTLKSLQMVLPLVGASLLTVALLLIFRLLYFGFPFPNTYYAKVSPSLLYNLFQGGKYLAKYCISDLVVFVSVISLIIMGVHVILAFVKKHSINAGSISLVVICCTGLLIPLLTGGDHFGSFRFYQNIYPILLVCLLHCVRFLLPLYVHTAPRFLLSRKVILVGVVLLIAVQGARWIKFDKKSIIAHEFAIAENGRRDGTFIANLFSNQSCLPKIGVITAGGIKYTYPGEVIDLMGLNNIMMAHFPGDRKGVKNHAAFEKPVFFKLKPEIVIYEHININCWKYNKDMMRSSFQNRALKYIFDDTSFTKLYTLAAISRKDMEPEEALIGWYLKDYLYKLKKPNSLNIEMYVYSDNKIGSLL
jgi:hypothetical protein